MKLTIPALLFAGFALGCAQEAPPTPAPAAPNVASTPTKWLSEPSLAALKKFQEDANKFVADLDEGASADALKPLAQSMLDQAVIVAPEYMALNPACEEHLSAALKIVDLWPTLGPEKIEKGYHKGDALPPTPPDADCYHMKDVIVHPATALAVLAQPEVDRTQARNEVFEVIVHAQVVASGVGLNGSDGD